MIRNLVQGSSSKIARTITIMLLVSLHFLFGGSARANDASKICGGRFERLVNGFTVVDRELESFIKDQVTIRRCLDELSDFRSDHQVIAGFLLQHIQPPALSLAASKFLAACQEGNNVGCVYSASHEQGTAKTVTEETLLREFSKLLPSRLPVVQTTVARLLLAKSDSGSAEKGRALELLRMASTQGDYWATMILAIQLRQAGHYSDGFNLLVTASEQGNVQATLEIAQSKYLDSRDLVGAFGWYKMCAEQSDRFFLILVSECQYMVGLMLYNGTGIEKNIVDARRWFQMSADLGNEKAIGWLK